MPERRELLLEVVDVVEILAVIVGRLSHLADADEVEDDFAEVAAAGLEVAVAAVGALGHADATRGDGEIEGDGSYPEAFPINERLTMLAEPRWLQRW